MQEYVVTALQMFSLDAVNATEFLEVYKGVVPPGEFSGMLDELTSGTNMCKDRDCHLDGTAEGVQPWFPFG